MSINDQVISQSSSVGGNGPYGFRETNTDWTVSEVLDEVELKVTVQCAGDYDTVIIGLDDVTLTRQCGGILVK